MNWLTLTAFVACISYIYAGGTFEQTTVSNSTKPSSTDGGSSTSNDSSNGFLNTDTNAKNSTVEPSSSADESTTASSSTNEATSTDATVTSDGESTTAATSTDGALSTDATVTSDGESTTAATSTDDASSTNATVTSDGESTTAATSTDGASSTNATVTSDGESTTAASSTDDASSTAANSTAEKPSIVTTSLDIPSKTFENEGEFFASGFDYIIKSLNIEVASEIETETTTLGTVVVVGLDDIARDGDVVISGVNRVKRISCPIILNKVSVLPINDKANPHAYFAAKGNLELRLSRKPDNELLLDFIELTFKTPNEAEVTITKPTINRVSLTYLDIIITLVVRPELKDIHQNIIKDLLTRQDVQDKFTNQEEFMPVFARYRKKFKLRTY